MKAILTARVPELDLAEYKNTLHEFMVSRLKEAATKWLDETAMSIPVWSGSSRTTFSPLASHVEYALSIGATAPNTVNIGLEYGEATYEVNQTPGIYKFSYTTSLPRLLVNEKFDATQWGFHLINPGPYEFEKRGETKFEFYAASVELPDATLFIHGVII